MVLRPQCEAATHHHARGLSQCVTAEEPYRIFKQAVRYVHGAMSDTLGDVVVHIACCCTYMCWVQCDERGDRKDAIEGPLAGRRCGVPAERLPLAGHGSLGDDARSLCARSGVCRCALDRTNNRHPWSPHWSHDAGCVCGPPLGGSHTVCFFVGHDGLRATRFADAAAAAAAAAAAPRRHRREGGAAAETQVDHRREGGGGGGGSNKDAFGMTRCCELARVDDRPTEHVFALWMCHQE